MANEPTYVFTLSEFRRVYKDIFMLGVRSEELNLDPEQVDLCCDGWLEANGSDFQLENGGNRGPSGPSVLSEPQDDLRDDIETDKKDDKGLSGFFTVEDPVHRGM
jgi:hypothetical protein